jgi:hypothetical protein
MHSLVKSQIEDIRRQAQTAGGAMLMQQQFGKQGMALPRWLFYEDWDPVTALENDPNWRREKRAGADERWLPARNPSVLDPWGPFATMPRR